LPVLIRNTAFAFMDMGKAASISMCMVVILFSMTVFYTYFYGRAEEELRY
jgi:ABC-type sugar transport system permease subunit